MERGRSTLLSAAVSVAILGSAACGDGGDSKRSLEKRVALLEAKVSSIQKQAATPPEPTAAPKVPPSDAASKTLEALRGRRLSLEFTNEQAARVLMVVLDAADVNWALSPSASSALNTAVTLKVTDATAHDLLDVLTPMAGVRWTVGDSGIVQITTTDGR